MWNKRAKNPFYTFTLQTLFQVLMLWPTFRMCQVINYRRNWKRDIDSKTNETKKNQTPDWVKLWLSLFSSAVLCTSIWAEMQAGLHSPFWKNDLRQLAWWSSTKTGSIFSCAYSGLSVLASTWKTPHLSLQQTFLSQWPVFHNEDTYSFLL